MFVFSFIAVSYKYTYRYVGHVSAIEKSDLEQVWRRKRPCSKCLTLFFSLDSAGGGLGRARVVSRQRVLFLFFLSTYPSIYSYV